MGKIMTPLVFVMCLLTVGMGAATLIISAIAYLHSPITILKRYMAVQAIVLMDAFNNSVCAFLQMARSDWPLSASIYTYLYAYIMTALVAYPLAAFSLEIAGIILGPSLRRFLLCLSFSMSVPSLTALWGGIGREGHRTLGWRLGLLRESPPPRHDFSPGLPHISADTHRR
jgi:hypothetical protein